MKKNQAPKVIIREGNLGGMMLPRVPALTYSESVSRLENLSPLSPKRFRSLIGDYVRKITFDRRILFSQRTACLTVNNEIFAFRSKDIEEVAGYLTHEITHLYSGVFPSLFSNEQDWEYQSIESMIERFSRHSLSEDKEGYLVSVGDLVSLGPVNRRRWRRFPKIDLEGTQLLLWEGKP